MQMTLKREDIDTGEGLDLSRILERGDVRSVYQPILNISTGRVLGFEALSRGVPPLERPDLLFGQGRREGMTWELEALCRSTSLRQRIEKGWHDDWRLFLNVSPSVFMDDRFSGWLAEAFLETGCGRGSRVVLELTETERVSDFERLCEALHTVRSMGFQVALDDLGSGNAGIPSLVKAKPDFIKLDRFLVKDIHKDTYRQNLVRTFVDFAGRVGSVPIAEGVEEWEELESLAHMGVCFFQGFLLGRPSPIPTLPEETLVRRAQDWYKRANPDDHFKEDRVGDLVSPSVTVHPDEMTGAEMDLLFRKEADLGHVVVVGDDGIPAGLVTRQGFFGKTGGAFGYHVFQRQPVIFLAKTDFLKVSCRTSIQMLSDRAMKRSGEDLYDPVVVTDELGRFTGTITMKQIIVRSGEVEVERALNANPLTGLPGNRHIEKWIHDNLQLGMDFTVIYADLDRFKEYNDRYGFIQGDRLICLTGDVLRNGLISFPVGTRLGHVGGDDFVFVCPGSVDRVALQEICEAFDSRKRSFFSEEDQHRGFYEAEDRLGEIVQVRLVTLSLAAVESSRLGRDVHPAELTEIAASLKHRAKQITAREKKSAFCFDRRVYEEVEVTLL